MNGLWHSYCVHKRQFFKQERIFYTECNFYNYLVMLAVCFILFSKFLSGSVESKT